MPGRDLKGDYRYAYQGQEKDTETGKEAFELRLWDSRIGRWLTTDPYGQFNSPYLGMGNNPITMVDPDGGMACPNPPCNGGDVDGGTLDTVYLTGSGGGGASYIPDEQRFSGSMAQWQNLTNNQFSSNHELADLQWQVSYGQQFDRLWQDINTWRIDATGFAENFDAGWQNWDPDGIGNFWMNATAVSVGGTIGIVGGSSILGAYFTGGSLFSSTSQSVSSYSQGIMIRHGVRRIVFRNSLGQFARGTGVRETSRMYFQRMGLNGLGQATRSTLTIPPNWGSIARWAVGAGLSGATGYYYYNELFDN